MNENTDAKVDKKRHLALQKKYNQRITIAKQGREFFAQKDYVNAAKRYNEYLAILSELNEVEDIYHLTPSMFDEKTQVTEMLLISHVYWDLSRVNEMTPKLQVAYNKCMKQFVRFTANQPYQVLNAEMLRKYIKKNKHKTPQLGVLNHTYSEIFVQSKKCYIATMCFGPNAIETNTLRHFKLKLLQLPFGEKLVSLYYFYSSKLVDACEERKVLRLTTTSFSKPILICFAYVLKRSILK